MKTIPALILVAAFLAGCATAAAPSRAAAPNTYTGEVWTWDEAANTVTLRRGFETFRVNVTPDQFIGLQLHSIATIHGTLAGPAPLPVVTTPPPSTYSVVPRGAADQVDLTGKVTAVNTSDVASIESARGPIQVWVAPGAANRFANHDVAVHVSVTPITVVPQGAAAATNAQPAAAAASPSSEPGDYAVVNGPIVALDPTGRMTISSPRGPVQVWVPDVNRYHMNDWVQVRTAVRSQ